MQASDWTKNGMSGRLKWARLRAGLNQAALAEKFGADQSTLSRVENGKIPRKELMARAAAFVMAAEQSTDGRYDQIAESVAKSTEFRALIARIASEL
jgi:transcriptional regulator with XRE-family HTH domain